MLKNFDFMYVFPKKTWIAFLKAPLCSSKDHTESSAPAPPEKQRFKVAATQQTFVCDCAQPAHC